eukprot:TRINITY_DN118_c0_g2_i3.p3 TRINITY_DN118_c0_g2~~TRINITY_DN118_c0_g2_i3.p3  ORF type:complete len:109 (-),score=30.78 TRINITY_DN118_c0_g2_i3:1703-2029(-)
MTHRTYFQLLFRYVLRAIYNTKPIGGQSRAQGTGGSTPPFLKVFLDQTVIPGLEVIGELNAMQDQLSSEQVQLCERISHEFSEFEIQMAKIKARGLELEGEERKLGFE